MAWNGNINQYVRWNVSSDNLVISKYDVMQGLKYSPDAQYSIVLSNNNSYEYNPSNTYPAVKVDDVVFTTIAGSSYGLKPAGYFYNGMPVFTNGNGYVFKSRINEWILIENDYTEPRMHIDSSTEVFKANDGDDLRQLTATQPEQFDYYRMIGDTLDDKLTSDGEDLMFENLDGDEIEFETSNPIWTKENVSSQKYYVTPENIKNMKALSSMLGIYRCTGKNPIVVGSGRWEDENQHLFITTESFDHWVYDVRAIKNSYGIQGYIDPIGYTFKGAWIGFQEKPDIFNFQVNFNGNATFRAQDEHSHSVDFSIPFKGWYIGSDSEQLFHSHHPWYR